MTCLRVMLLSQGEFRQRMCFSVDRRYVGLDSKRCDGSCVLQSFKGGRKGDGGRRDDREKSWR